MLKLQELWLLQCYFVCYCARALQSQAAARNQKRAVDAGGAVYRLQNYSRSSVYGGKIGHQKCGSEEAKSASHRW
jgi:hypothetical protein